MIIRKEESLTNFDFWSGAKDTVNYLTTDEINTIESMLKELNPEGMDETTVNDFFWFDTEVIADWLGYNSFEEIMNRGE